MSDTGRVLAAFERGDLLRPATDDASTVDLALALAHLNGVEDCAMTAAADRIADLIGPAKDIVFVLIDGFGMDLVEREPSGSALRGATMELRAVFPSSTAPALTSLATGLWPSGHAVPGWWTYLPDAALTATVLPLVDRFTDRPLDAAAAAQAYPVPAITRRYARSHARVTTRLIENSAYSEYSNPASSSYGYTSLGDAVGFIEREIARSDGDTYTYFYVPYVDAAEHTHGPDSGQVRRVIKSVRERMGALARRLEGRARIVVSADHGQISVGERERHIIDRGDPMMAHLLFPPTCEPRTPAFHVRPGHHEAFETVFRQRFGQAFALLALDEVERMGLLGRTPVTAETRRRLGDYLGVALGHDVLLYEPAETLRTMQGFHGGLLPSEMRIPLIVL